VPVALLFDAKAVAGRAGVRFSDGNLASRWATHGIDVAFLRSLDFREIYHEGPTNPENTRRLTARRQAEVIVPGELPIEDLKFVATRSEAKRLTLLTLLSETAWTRSPLIERVLAETSLFHCRWTFIERATLVGDQVRFLFNPDTDTPGPFNARIVWTNPTTGESVSESKSMRGLGVVNAPVPVSFRGPVVKVVVHLDDALAFSGLLEQAPSSTLLGPG
jgi:hypothetical protein